MPFVFVGNVTISVNNTKIHCLMYHKEHLLEIDSVIFNTRSADFKAAVRLETWNGVLGTTGKSNDCSYLQR